jgi:hypothetical protein
MIENLDQFDREVTFSGCTIITVPGREGFLWLDSLGQLHNAGMNICVNSGKVQVLVDDVTRRLSYGWHKE